MLIICKSFDFWYITGQEVYIGFIWCAVCNWDLRSVAVFMIVQQALLVNLIDSAPLHVRIKNRNGLVFANCFLTAWAILVYFNMFPNLSNGGISLGGISAEYRQLFQDRMVNLLLFTYRLNLYQFWRPGELLLVVAPVSHFIYR